MYALPYGVVVRRRKSLLVPVLLLLIGAAMIVLNNIYGEALSNNFRSALVFIGGVLAIVGGVMCLVRLLGSNGVPFHNGKKCFLLYDELYFERRTLSDIVRSVDEGDVQHLLGMKHAQVPAIAVALFRTPDNNFAAMQAYEYADLEYKPLSMLKIVGEELRQ